MILPEYLERRMDSVSAHRAPSATRDGLSARSSTMVLLWAALDFVSAEVAGILAFRLRATSTALDAPALPAHSWLSIPFVSIVYLLVFGVYLVAFSRIYGLYRSAETRSALNEQRMTIQAVMTAGLLLCGTLYVMRAYAVSRVVVALTLMLTMIAMMTRRLIVRRIRQRRFRDGREVRNVLIVGEGRVAQALRNHLQSLPSMGFRFKGFVAVDDLAPTVDSRRDVVASVKNCVQVARTLFVDEIYLTVPAQKDVVLGVVEEARANGIDVRVVPDLYDGLAWNAPVEYVGQFPTIPLHAGTMPKSALLFKRLLDLAFAAVALLLFAPFMLLLGVLIRWDSPGPVFYRAQRVGRKGRAFTCFKFRTMVDEAEQLRRSLEHRNERDTVLFKISNDPRITRVGGWLRKYSLDELPQLYNVLVGDMSIVGPRPPLATEVEHYQVSHLRRLDVLPGITGLWQVEARQDPSFDSYISLDTAYVENWSLSLDLKILLRTVGVVFSGTGT